MHDVTMKFNHEVYLIHLGIMTVHILNLQIGSFNKI